MMRRLKLLILCLALGMLVALIGQVVIASPWWWLAVPGALAAGWLLVADPTRGAPPR